MNNEREERHIKIDELVNELQDSVANDDDKAVQIAMFALVSDFLKSYSDTAISMFRIADALEKHVIPIPDEDQKHEWITSTLDHGETRCKKCHMTNREATELNQSDICCGPFIPDEL